MWMLSAPVITHRDSTCSSSCDGNGGNNWALNALHLEAELFDVERDEPFVAAIYRVSCSHS